MDRTDWNRRYASQELFWSGEPNLFLVQEVADLPPDATLRMTPAQVAAAYPADWRTLVGA